MTFRPISRLSLVERDTAARLLGANPMLALYWATGIEDLAQGIDNRLVHFGRNGHLAGGGHPGDGAGIILGATFGDLTVFSFCGHLDDADIAHCAAQPGAVELHVPEVEAVRYTALAAQRLKQSRDMVLMASPTRLLDETLAGCRDLQAAHVRDVAAFYREHYPETVFDDYMLSMPFVGAFADDRLVACAGTIALAPDLRAALIGHFSTAPECRGQGHAGRLGRLLLDRLAQRGFETAHLATTVENAAAIRTYEKLGFAITERLVQLDLMP